MSSLDYDSEREAFLDFYAASEVGLLRAAVDAMSSVLELLLTDRDEFPSPTVSGRVKDRRECLDKFNKKYRKNLETESTPYSIKDHISDLIGLRVVCYYETDIPLVAALIKENFEVIDVTDKSGAMEEHDNTFGYKGLHLDAKLKEPRSSLPEYRKFGDLRFEIQIRTHVQNAWSTIDHKIKYKREIPQSLKRRINRLAALFELADQEFVNIREETQSIERTVKDAASVNDDVVVQLLGPGNLLEPFRFVELATALFPGYPFDPSKAEDFVRELRSIDEGVTIDAVRDTWERQRDVVLRYRKYQQETHRIPLNPYTQLRHAMFRDNPDVYSLLLYPRQRSAFEAWIAGEAA